MRKTRVISHIRRTKRGKVPVRQHSRKVYQKWRKLVNMTPAELRAFKATEEGKKAGLSKQQARELGIKSGQESAEWILRMKPKAKTFEQAEKNWTDKEWEWAQRQNSFNARMLGNKGPLYDKKGRMTRKHTSLLIWGHNPKKNMGAGTLSKMSDEAIEYLLVNPPKRIPEGTILKGLKDRPRKIFKESIFEKSPVLEQRRIGESRKSFFARVNKLDKLKAREAKVPISFTKSKPKLPDIKNFLRTLDNYYTARPKFSSHSARPLLKEEINKRVLRLKKGSVAEKVPIIELKKRHNLNVAMQVRRDFKKAVRAETPEPYGEQATAEFRELFR